jgi:hypothetical protein
VLPILYWTRVVARRLVRSPEPSAIVETRSDPARRRGHFRLQPSGSSLQRLVADRLLVNASLRGPNLLEEGDGVAHLPRLAQDGISYLLAPLDEPAWHLAWIFARRAFTFDSRFCNRESLLSIALATFVKPSAFA